MRRIHRVRFFWALLLIFIFCQASRAYAEYIENGLCGDNLTWSLDFRSGSLTINGQGEMLSHPWNNDQVKLVKINEGVTSISEWAFANNAAIKDITIPDSVTHIGEGAFSYCQNLQTVNMPQKLKSIGIWAFRNCSQLQKINIPNETITIGEEAFLFCDSLTNIYIPASISSIGINAFGGCAALTAISVSENNRFYISLDGVVFTKAENCLICYPSGKEGPYDIPDKVTAIKEKAFYCCDKLTRITIPASVTSIGERAFLDCIKLHKMYISPDNEVYCTEADVIYNKSRDCLLWFPTGKQHNFTIPYHVTSIGKYAFYGNDRMIIEMSNNITYIDPKAFIPGTKLIVYDGNLETYPANWVRENWPQEDYVIDPSILYYGERINTQESFYLELFDEIGARWDFKCSPAE